MRSGSGLDQVWIRWTQMKMRSGGVLLLLALASMSRAAPLCEQLLTPVQQFDMSGHWYFQAVTGKSDGYSCVFAAVMESVQSMSATFNFTLKETPNTYDVSVQVNLFGLCNYTKHENITLPFVERINDVTVVSVSLLPLSTCSDCVVMLYMDGLAETLTLYSRRQSVTLLELKKLQILASCLKMPRPWIMNTDYDVGNCKDLSQTDPDDEVKMMTERESKLKTDIEKCDHNTELKQKIQSISKMYSR